MNFKLAWGGLHTVISGGQTGADQGGLIAAWRRDVETGGQAPLYYKTQDCHNPLLEVLGLTQGSDYAGRTRANIRNSDGTVIIAHHLGSPGTVLTRREVKLAEKPLLELNVFDLVQIALGNPSVKSNDLALEDVISHSIRLRDFVVKNQIQVLNVSGNREIQSASSIHGTAIMMTISEWIVGMTIDTLVAEGLVITRQEKRNF